MRPINDADVFGPISDEHLQRDESHLTSSCATGLATNGHLPFMCQFLLWQVAAAEQLCGILGKKCAAIRN